MVPSIGISLETAYDCPMRRALGLIRDAGFAAVSPLWGQDLSAIASETRALGLALQSLHAPPKGMAALWQPEAPDSMPVQRAMLASLEACAELQIPVLVAHGWQGHGYTFPDAPLDFTFWDQLVTRAQTLGITVAFENLEGEEYLSALMDRYRAVAQVGFCWDSGHDRCYPHTMDFLLSYGSRLRMTHLNDNFGVSGAGYTSKDDLHLLPLDGNTDWTAQLARLRTACPQDTLNFEVKQLSHGITTYPGLTLEQFITTAGARARTIAERSQG